MLVYGRAQSCCGVFIPKKTVANDSGTCVAKSNCKTLMPEIDKKRSVIITVFYLSGAL